jgi:hypothetical protein
MATRHAVITGEGAATVDVACTEAPITAITWSTIHTRIIHAPAKRSIVGPHPTWSTTRTTRCDAPAPGSPVWIAHLAHAHHVAALPNPTRTRQCAATAC